MPDAHVLGLDPVSWTSSERRIRCPECQTQSAGDPGGSVMRSSAARRCGSCWMMAKPSPSSARDLDLTPSARRSWVLQARADRTKGRTGLTTAEREELARLRKENRELRTEREILKKAAAGSTGQCNSGRSVSAGVAYPSVWRGRELRRCAMVLRSACV